MTHPELAPRWCPCGHFMVFHLDRCSQCARRALFGELVWLNDYNYYNAPRRYLDGLDAIADLLIDGARERKTSRRTLNEAISVGEHDARSAYEDGVSACMDGGR